MDIATRAHWDAEEESRMRAVMKEEGASLNWKPSVDFKSESFRYEENSQQKVKLKVAKSLSVIDSVGARKMSEMKYVTS